ncbi:hypothetical protein AGMMS49944_10130 [Spirochaetia bacterium]|nr:hypothetical protein AGMMS49944_10130 [Spirochaetia bacterium]
MVAPADATNQAVTWISSDTTKATVANGVVTAVAAGTATITVTTTDGSKTATCTVTVSAHIPTNLETIFSTTGVTATFNAVHTAIVNGTYTTKIFVGDYIDLPSLTITGSGTITDQDLGTPGNANYHGRLLRLIVVGINSFKRNSTGAGSVTANNPGAPDHVVFQFQNVPVTHNMNGLDTNVGGYAGSAMKTYLTGDFLTDLKTATGLTNTELWAPSRRVWNGFLSGQYGSSSSNTTVDTIADELWLPTEWEMFGSRSYSSPHEAIAGQARLEYYAMYSSRIKYDNSNTANLYWSASPYPASSADFCDVASNGSSYHHTASSVYGCAPAFCVK